jgi:hypothetical protein
VCDVPQAFPQRWEYETPNDRCRPVGCSIAALACSVRKFPDSHSGVLGAMILVVVGALRRYERSISLASPGKFDDSVLPGVEAVTKSKTIPVTDRGGT